MNIFCNHFRLHLYMSLFSYKKVLICDLSMNNVGIKVYLSNSYVTRDGEWRDKCRDYCMCPRLRADCLSLDNDLKLTSHVKI